MNIANLTGLEYRTGLHYFYLHLNHISAISAIANLANLTVLYLQINRISDIGPWVQNEGLGTGNLVNVQVNPLIVVDTRDSMSRDSTPCFFTIVWRKLQV